MRVTGPNFPLDIIVSDEYFWVTDIRPPKILQFDLQGNHVYTWLLPTEGPTAWLEMHSFSVDTDGNVYGTDNQYARPQKLVPSADADPRHLIQRQYVPR
jgi:streptogramin lyase